MAPPRGCPLPLCPPTEVVVHPGTQRILEGGDPRRAQLSTEHLEAEADGLLLTLAALQVRGPGLGSAAVPGSGLHSAGRALLRTHSTKCSTARKVERWRRGRPWPGTAACLGSE